MKKMIHVLGLAISLAIVPGVFTSTQAQTTVYKTKHPSRTRKSTLIGAGAGAVAGALITHKASGALVGGAVGGGAGYLYGKHRTKKYGHLPVKKKYKHTSY